MALSQGPSGKKDLNFELNLMPVFDILAVCICFLLMTVVWVEIKSIETKQSIGGQSVAESTQASSIWLNIDDKNNVEVTIKSTSKTDRQYRIVANKGQLDIQKITAMAQRTQLEKISIAHILPTKSTKYDQVIQLMDLLKQNGIKDIGLSPI